ncbi:hypothetical protein RI129_000942 [Pyrocoelia pectoralis]|uniref:TOG domain-containing protein n=1 Tax=Pyrocoelia pectoralis TaxID=417401 RepID=A0AAN7ZWK1_9COLE
MANYSITSVKKILDSQGFEMASLSPDSLTQSPNNSRNFEKQNCLRSHTVNSKLEEYDNVAQFLPDTKRTEAFSDNEQIGYARKNQLNQYLDNCVNTDKTNCEGNFNHPNTPLIDTFLAKKMSTCRAEFLRQTSPLRNLQSCQSDNLTTQSYMEPRNDTISSPRQVIPQVSRFVIKNIKNRGELNYPPAENETDEDDEETYSSPNASVTMPLTTQKKQTSFMLPTVASERKNQQHLMNSISQLVSSSQRSASVSPNRDSLTMGSINESIPYFDQVPVSIQEHNNKISPKIKGSTSRRSPIKLSSAKEESLKLDLELLRLNSPKVLHFFNYLFNSFTINLDVSLKGLAEVTELCRNVDPDIIYPYMTNINQKLLQLLRSPRSHVARTACQIAGHLFESIKDTRRPEFDDIVEVLLTKTADASKFIRKDANLSLDCMVTHIPIYHAVKSICLKGPQHKNPLVRSASIRLIICAVVIADPSVILHSQVHEYTRKKIIQFLPAFLSDRHLETRKYGERLHKIFSKDPSFDAHLKKYLDSKEISRINCITKSEKRKR